MLTGKWIKHKIDPYSLHASLARAVIDRAETVLRWSDQVGYTDSKVVAPLKAFKIYLERHQSRSNQHKGWQQNAAHMLHQRLSPVLRTLNELDEAHEKHARETAQALATINTLLEQQQMTSDGGAAYMVHKDSIPEEVVQPAALMRFKRSRLGEPKGGEHNALPLHQALQTDLTIQEPTAVEGEENANILQVTDSADVEPRPTRVRRHADNSFEYKADPMRATFQAAAAVLENLFSSKFRPIYGNAPRCTKRFGRATSRERYQAKVVRAFNHGKIPLQKMELLLPITDSADVLMILSKPIVDGQFVQRPSQYDNTQPKSFGNRE